MAEEDGLVAEDDEAVIEEDEPPVAAHFAGTAISIHSSLSCLLSWCGHFMPPEKAKAFSSKALVSWIAVSIVALALGAFVVGEMTIDSSTFLGTGSSNPASVAGGELTVDENRPVASIDDIKAQLSPEKRGRFEEALSHLIVHHMLESESGDLGTVTDATYGRLHGMTAGEVILLADSIEAAEN